MVFCGTRLRPVLQEAQDINSENEFENYILKITATPPRGRWVKVAAWLLGGWDIWDATVIDTLGT